MIVSVQSHDCECAARKKVKMESGGIHLGRRTRESIAETEDWA